MTPDDLPEVLAIEQSSYMHPWTRAGFRSELERRPAVCLVVRDAGRVLGYMIIWRILPEIHILNIAIHPRHRRKGLGHLLFSYVVEYAQELDATEICLEVRPTNDAARALYRKMGFVQTGIRPHYYADEGEDALLMTLYLKEKWTHTPAIATVDRAPGAV